MSKIAILTNFMEMIPGYSLTGIVEDQCLMFQKYGHEVHVYVNEQYNPKYDEAWGRRLRRNEENPVAIHRSTPFSNLIDYATIGDISEDHVKIAQKMEEMIRDDLGDFDFIITHDLIFTGWNVPYAAGIKKASPHLPDVRWMHWVHSVPSGNKDWWRIQEYGYNHKIIFPNKSDRRRVAEQFCGYDDNVRIIPHIKDLRSWADFGVDSCDFIDDYPDVMNADVVQVYPASADRLSAKGVKKVMHIFRVIKAMGLSVCLVIANQWATGKQRKEDLNNYIKVARAFGLIPGQEVIFTSEWRKETPDSDGVYGLGVPRRMLREIAMCANLFIFPTNEESFGLASLEMILTSGCMPVLNRSLIMQTEVHGGYGLYFDFGSHENSFTPDNWNRYLGEVAMVIVGRMRESESIQAKTFVRQSYNFDAVYHRHYAPVMAEAELWGGNI